MSQTIDTLAIEIEANAADSVDGVRKLSRALTSLSKSISSVNSAGISNVAGSLNSMSNAFSNVGTSSGKAVSGTKKYTNILPTLTGHTNKAAKSTKSLAYYFGKFYANMFLAVRGAKALGSAVSDTMEYMESFNFWDVAISSASAKEVGKENAEAYVQGIKERLADFNQKMTGFKMDTSTGDISISNMANLGVNLENLTTFQAEIISVTSSLGLCTSVSEDTSKALSMLAADMSSLKNVDLETVMTNFQSGLIGQSRALYKYGIDITNATLQTYAYKYGIEKAVSEMTQAEKMQLRMLAILDQSKVAWGDLANTIEQPSNQFRVLSNGVKNLAITIGKLLMPIVSATLPYLNAMVKALQTFAEWLAKVLGVKLEVENTGTGTTDIFDDIEDSADSATESVNKLKKATTTLGIDELNINNPNSDSGSGSGGSVGGGVDLSDEINKALAEYEAAWEEAYANMTDKATEMADTIVEAFKRQDYKGIGTYISTGITNALSIINWDTVYSVTEHFGRGLAEFLNGLITPEEFAAIGDTVAGAVNTSIRGKLSFVNSFDFSNLGESLGTGVNTALSNINWHEKLAVASGWGTGIASTLNSFMETTDFSLIGSTIANKANEAITTVLSFGIEFDFGTAGKSIAETINGWFDEFDFEGLADTFNVWASGLAEAIGEFIINFDWLGALKGIGEFLGNLGFVEEIFNFDFASTFFEKMMESFESAGESDNCLEIGIRIFEGILNGFTGVFTAIAEPFADFFDWVWDGICNIFGIASPAKEMKPLGEYILNGILEGFTGAFGNIKKAISLLLKKFDDFKQGIKQWCSGIRDKVVEWAEEVSEKFTEWKDNIEETIAEWKENLEDKFDTWKSNVTKTVKDWKSNIEDKFTTWKTNVTSTVSGWVSDVQNKFNVWKTNVSSTVETWKNDVQSKFDAWKLNVASTVESWKNEVKEKFDVWKSNTALTIETWKTEIQNKFTAWKSNVVSTVEEWKKNIQDKFTEFTTNTKQTVSEWFGKVSEFFGFDKWNFSGIKEGLANAFNSAIEAVKEIWNSFTGWISSGWETVTGLFSGATASITSTVTQSTVETNTKTNTVTEPASMSSSASSSAATKKTLADTIKEKTSSVDRTTAFRDSLINMRAFADGGITSADIFMANENGIPELIGTIGGRTAIASGMEVTGITDAIYDTGSEEIRLLREQNALLMKLLDKDMSVHIGDREIARANARGQRSMGYTLITEV